MKERGQGTLSGRYGEKDQMRKGKKNGRSKDEKYSQSTYIGQEDVYIDSLRCLTSSKKHYFLVQPLENLK